MNNKEKIKKYITYAILGLTVLQFLFIVYLNIFECRSWIDHDASMLYSHTINMWERGTYILPFYVEETFLNIDTSCLLAMPLYGLTKDVFLAYGISNIIFAVITIMVIMDITMKMDVPKAYRYIVVLLYLIPYRMGMLEYTSMMFYECSFYNIPVLLGLMCIDLYLYREEDTHSFKYWIIMSVYLLLIVITAFSRGTYAMLIALLPIILCYVLEVILSEDGLKHVKRSKVVQTCLTLLAYGIGMGLGKITGKSPEVTGYSLVLPRDIFENFVHVFWGHLSLFMDSGDPEVFSIEGIMALITFGFSILIIILLVFNLRHCFKDDPYAGILRFLTLVYIWDCVVCGLTDCSRSKYAFPERYLLPGFVPLIISFPIMLIYIEKIKRQLLRKALRLAICVISLLTFTVANINTFVYFGKNADELQGIREVLAFARNNGIDSVYFLNDDNAGLISRSLDHPLKVVSVDTLDDGTYDLRVREDYMCALDRAYYDDDNLLAVTWNNRPEDVLPEYMLSSYQSAGDVKDYHLFTAGSNKFDDSAGFPLNDGIMNESIDFCHTKGYQIAGQIDLYGYLEAEGNDNFILVSPLLDAPYCPCDVTVNYEMGYKTSDEEYDNGSSRTVGLLQILNANDMSVIASSELNSDSQDSTVTVDSLQPCYVAVTLNSGEKITLCDVHFSVH